MTRRDSSGIRSVKKEKAKEYSKFGEKGPPQQKCEERARMEEVMTFTSDQENTCNSATKTQLLRSHSCARKHSSEVRLKNVCGGSKSGKDLQDVSINPRRTRKLQLCLGNHTAHFRCESVIRRVGWRTTLEIRKKGHGQTKRGCEAIEKNWVSQSGVSAVIKIGDGRDHALI
jgi:hypothetical protein